MVAADGNRVSSAGRQAFLAALGWIVLTNPGSFTMVLGPVFTNAFIAGRGLSAAQAAGLGATELAGMALATLAIGFLPMGRLAQGWPGRTAALGVALAMAGQVATLAVAGLVPLALVRLVIGAGTGAAFTLAIAALARSANPDRIFGFQMATNQVSIFLLMNMVAALSGSGGAMIPIMVVAGATALSLLATLLLGESGRAAPVEARGEVGGGVPRLAAFGAIATCFVFNAGVGAFWPLVGQVAQGAGVPPAGVAQAFAWAPLSAIVGGLAAALAGNRIPRLPLLLAGNAVMAATMAMMGQSSSALALLGYRNDYPGRE